MKAARQKLIDAGAVVLGLGLLALLAWLLSQNVAMRLTTQKMPPAMLDKVIFVMEGMSTMHWVLLLAGLLLVGWPLLRQKTGAAAPAGAGPAAQARRKATPARIAFCNVLQAESDVRRLWQFSTAGRKVALQREESRLPNERLPAKLITKDWQSIFQPKLNVAWLPSGDVFLRVLHLPRTDDLEELQATVELQLEKVSPMPVAQVVWTFERLSTGPADLQTVIVVLVARSVVEEFLGKLESQGYLADRLELPLLDQIRATQVRADGVWIYTGVSPDPWTCLAAWWYGGVLYNLTLVRLPDSPNRAELFQEQLRQMAWAGEVEGWLTSPPKLHVVAEGEVADAWRSLLPADQPVEVIPPLSGAELAGLTVRRAVANGVGANLLPAEFATRYRQQFVDRLWMQGIGAALLVYVAVVLVYFGLTEWARLRLAKINDEITLKAGAYTNALQMKEQVKVLQDQLDLQYAALDTYKVVADLLPDGLVVDQLNFERGRKVTLIGSAATDDMSKVQDFNDALRKATVKGQPLFAKVQAPSINPRQGGQIQWSFWGELNRTEMTE